MMQLQRHCRLIEKTLQAHFDATKTTVAEWRIMILGAYSEGVGAPIVDWVDFLTEKAGFVGTVLSIRSVLWTSNMPKNALAAGLRPGPHWGSSRRSPDLLVGWRGGHPFPNRAFGAQLRRSALVAPNVKSWLRPWMILVFLVSMLDHYFLCRKQLALTFSAEVDVTWDDYGTIATFVCPPGWYFADGGTTRTLICTDGSWLRYAPTCTGSTVERFVSIWSEHIIHCSAAVKTSRRV